MATTAVEAKTAPANGKSSIIEPISQPIAILTTDSARLYTHIHPALVLSLLLLGFLSLVNDPVTSLSWAIAPLTLLQAAYCVICLPPSSGSSNQSTHTKTPKRKRVQFAKTPTSTASRITTAVFSLVLTLSLGAPLLNVILILFGAPFTTHLWHNALCATHMALLGAFPLFYVYGVNARIWREISGAFLPFDEVWGATVGTMIGAWLGAVPIPLDWDRDWQKWPVTIVTGAYLGWAVFRLLGVYALPGKRIDLEG